MAKKQDPRDIYKRNNNQYEISTALQSQRREPEYNLAIVAANNHYAGFGSGTANTFRKMLDLSEVTW